MIYYDREELAGSPLRRRLAPRWDRPLPNQLYSVAVPRDGAPEGQHIRGRADEMFEGLFEEGRAYVDHYGDPN
jgi:hypothetical protein